MKITFLISIFILLFGFTISSAQTIDLDRNNQSSFSINVSDITYYKDIKSTQFFVNIKDIKNLEDVSYWKVSADCDDKMSIQLNPTSPNICGDSVRLKNIPNNSFYFLFKNKTPKSKDFSIKVKAFNYKGNGIYGDSVGFGWK
jgi:hypothetical protein